LGRILRITVDKRDGAREKVTRPWTAKASALLCPIGVVAIESTDEKRRLIAIIVAEVRRESIF
jgi:hypothetical protein